MSKCLTKQQRLDAFLSQPNIWTRISAMGAEQVLRLSSHTCELVSVAEQKADRSPYSVNVYYTAADLERLLVKRKEQK